MSVERVDHNTFLKKTREKYPIRLIYYPACGEDNNSLNNVFLPDEIVALDKEECWRDNSYILGDYAQSPFGDEVFDAIFFQDNHAKPKDLAEIFRTLKPEGVVIYSKNTCDDDVGPKGLRKVNYLRRVRFPFSSEYYSLYQKTEQCTKK